MPTVSNALARYDVEMTVTAPTSRASSEFNALWQRSLAGFLRAEPRLAACAVLAVIALVVWQLTALVGRSIPLPPNVRWAPAPALPQTAARTPKVNIGTINNANLFGAYQAAANADAASFANAPDTQLNFTLLGILLGSNNTDSRALIGTDGGLEANYLVGVDVAPGVSLQAIFVDRVVLERAGRLETLRLDKSSASNAPTYLPTAPESSPATAQMLSQIRTQVLNDPNQASQFVRVQPINGEGGLRGYRVYPGQQSEAFAAAGLQPGDVVVSINGTGLVDSNQALQLIQNLSDSPQVELGVERNGAVQSITLNVTPQ